jgi:hypothetical protein
MENYMGSRWQDSDSAANRVRELLTESGLPLEIDVQARCRLLVNSGQATHPDFSLTSARLVYTGHHVDGPPREVDQCVTITAEIDLSDTVIIQIFLVIPIECKRRANVEVFGFPYLGSSGEPTVVYLMQRSKERPALRYLKGLPRATATSPVFTTLVGSLLADRLVQGASQLTSGEPVVALTLLEIENGQKPVRVHKENLIYNAGAELYDFIYRDIHPMSKHDMDYSVRRALDNNTLQSLTDLCTRLALPRGLRAKWHHVLDFIEEEVNIGDFNTRFFSAGVEGLSSAIAFPVFIYLPIVCLDSSLFLVQTAHDNKITEFEERHQLITAIRPRWWPEQLGYYTVVPASESLLTVTNPVGLSRILEDLLEWFSSLVELLAQASKEEVERLPVEASIFNYIVSTSHQQKPA